MPTIDYYSFISAFVNSFLYLFMHSLIADDKLTSNITSYLSKETMHLIHFPFSVTSIPFRLFVEFSSYNI